MEKIVYHPIGLFHCEQTQPVDSPRQASLAEEHMGFVELRNDVPLEVLHSLDGFERIWLVYHFHCNDQWKPMVRPPRLSQQKRGVFATRSPYRPNGIGLSCVRLEKIEGRRIYCSEHDLLNETPILDIKPYLPYADSFADAKAGWTQEIHKYEVQFSENFISKARWLENEMGKPFVSVVRNQLQYEPVNTKIKRVVKLEEGFCFSYRTWRVYFSLSLDTVIVNDLKSGYSEEELQNSTDPYEDKDLHQNFDQVDFSKG